MAVLERLPLNERIFSVLKKMIQNGELSPGERVKEEEVAKRFGISRTPVREALKRLESLGFIERRRSSGYVVKRFDRDDIEEIYGIMGVLEEYAITLAVDNVTPSDIEKLKSLLTELEGALKEGDMRKVVRVNNKFHDILYGLSKRKRLIALINYFRELFNVFRRWLLIEKESATAALRDHWRIVELLELRDKGRLRRAIRSHINRGKKLTLKKLEEVGRGEEEENTDRETGARWA